MSYIGERSWCGATVGGLRARRRGGGARAHRAPGPRAGSGEGTDLPELPPHRLTARGVGGRPAPPQLRRLHPRVPDLRRHHRDHRVAYARREIRLARPRVREADLRRVFDHRAPRGLPALPLRRLLPEVLDVHDVHLLPDLLGLRASVLRRNLHRVPLVLRLGLAVRPSQVDSRDAGRALQPRRHRDPRRGQLVGHLHDVAGGGGRVGALKGGVWAAINNFTWMPINIHRLIATIVFGGTICAAYAALRFLGATTDEERARYDWMGYIGNFIALAAFIVLPFAGYYLGREIYAFNQTMGITMMGGFMSWLWIIQAILIGVLFLGSNYYLWLGMERIPGAERYRKYVPPMLIILTVGFMVWATPRSMVVTLDEARAMGGTHHPLLGFFGVMSAKNTVVNLMILTTFLSYILYRRANR